MLIKIENVEFNFIPFIGVWDFKKKPLRVTICVDVVL